MTKIQKTDLERWTDDVDAQYNASKAAGTYDRIHPTGRPKPDTTSAIVSGTVFRPENIASGLMTPPAAANYQEKRIPAADEIKRMMRDEIEATPPPLPPDPPPSDPFDITGSAWRRNLQKEPPHVIRALLDERRVRHHIRPPFAPAIMECHGTRLGNLGNFGIVAGKQKSGKSHVIAAMVAAYASGKKAMPLGFTGKAPAGRAGVLYFDTEMDAADVWIQLDRITRLSQISDHEIDSTIRIYQLRRFNAAERVKLIDTAIRDHAADCGLFVIDGIRDLMHDINSSDESNIVLADLMRWTDEYDIHGVVAIHYNKTSENMRGHIGTELANKCQYQIQTEKVPDADMFKMTMPTSRKKGIDGEIGWRMDQYEINDHETGTIPVELDSVGYERLREMAKPTNHNSRHTKTMADEYEPDAHRRLVEMVFKKAPDGSLRWGEILTALPNAFFKETGKEIAKEKAAGFRMRWREWTMIVPAGGTPNTKSSRWRMATPDEMENGWMDPMMDHQEPAADPVEAGAITPPPSADKPSKKKRSKS